jgi:hypothetical protein
MGIDDPRLALKADFVKQDMAAVANQLFVVHGFRKSRHINSPRRA